MVTLVCICSAQSAVNAVGNGDVAKDHAPLQEVAPMVTGGMDNMEVENDVQSSKSGSKSPNERWRSHSRSPQRRR